MKLPLNTVATVRVTSDRSGALGKPDRSRLEAAASQLADCGFRVSRIGRFGVSIEGPNDAFERELGVHIVPGDPVVAPAKPLGPELSKLIDLVEVAPKPILFSE